MFKKLAMWASHYETITDVPAEKLFFAISDISQWSKWDNELEFTKIEGAAKQGSHFVLKPKGGPNIKITIEEFLPPSRMVDIAHLPLAKIRTSHEFYQFGNQTTVRFTIQIWGVLGFFWRKVVGEKQIRDASKQTALFIDYARTHVESS